MTATPKIQNNKQTISNGCQNNWPPKVIIYTDGACRGNPGQSSTGLAVLNHKETTLYEEASLLGVQTNNFAEYQAVLRALELSTQNQVQSLVLKSDSQLLINQLNKSYKVRSKNIKPLYQACKKHLSKIPQVTLQHVRREQNKRADELANLILDTQTLI